MADWLDYQKLAASIYSELAPHARVVHDDKIQGHDSGIERQIDVAIYTGIATHQILIIVQAKDLKRPADLNVVGEFKSVIHDVRANKGVLICSHGFTKSAMEYGKREGIDLCTAHDARSRKWAFDLSIPLLWIENTADVRFELQLTADAVNPESLTFDPNVGKWITSSDGGATQKALSDVVIAEWNSSHLDLTPGAEHQHRIEMPGLRLVFSPTFSYPIDFLILHYRTHRKGWLGAFTFSQCKGILNHCTGELRARLRITDEDIPLIRDEKWPAIADLDAEYDAHPNLIVVERSWHSPECFTFRLQDIMTIRD